MRCGWSGAAAAILAFAVALSSAGCVHGTADAGFFGRLAEAGGAAWGPTLEPTSRDYYPPLAKELGQTGRVGVECSVDARGHAQNVVVLESGGLVFDDAARKLFADGRFLIPPDWSASGGPAKRFRYGVIFQLRGKSAVTPFEDHRLTVVIAGSAN